MATVEFGTVIHYNPDRRFGFLKLDEGSQLFFHLHSGAIIAAGGSDPEFGALAIRSQRQTREPKIGDRLAFRRGRSNDDRPKAEPWGYASEWEVARETIARRPVYRVFDQWGDPREGTWKEPELLWQGTNLDDAFSRWRQPSLKDTGGPTYEHDMIFQHRSWWEKKRQDEPDDAWKECNNPYSAYEARR
jgi:hypothetical protein